MSDTFSHVRGKVAPLVGLQLGVQMKYCMPTYRMKLPYLSVRVQQLHHEGVTGACSWGCKACAKSIPQLAYQLVYVCWIVAVTSIHT
jgi:hypothetical protein